MNTQLLKRSLTHISQDPLAILSPLQSFVISTTLMILLYILLSLSDSRSLLHWWQIVARHTWIAKEAGMQARLTKKVNKETKISQDQNDWILVTKTRRHRMHKQESKVIKKMKVSTKTRRDAMTEIVSKRPTSWKLKDPKRNGWGDYLAYEI
jgi:hypothetical protein